MCQDPRNGIDVAAVQIQESGARPSTQMAAGKLPFRLCDGLPATVQGNLLINVAKHADTAQNVVIGHVAYSIQICGLLRNGNALMRIAPVKDPSGDIRQWHLSFYVSFLTDIAQVAVPDIGGVQPDDVAVTCAHQSG